MTLKKILIHPNTELRRVASPVNEVTDEVRRLVDDLAETMYFNSGAGLAAPQIGVSRRLFVVDLAKIEEREPAQFLTCINPKLIRSGGSITTKEGCLSFPGIRERITRSSKVEIQALNREGRPFVLAADGLLATVLQHENDHLDGILLVDRVSQLKRRQIEKDLRKGRAGHCG